MLIAFKIALTSAMLWLIFGWLSNHANELGLPKLVHKLCLLVAGVGIVTFICSLFALVWLL